MEYITSTVVRAASPIVSQLSSKPRKPLSLVEKRMSQRHLCLGSDIEALCGPPHS